MTTKEKAKAYDEALKVLHKYDGANIMFTQDLKEEMFPELKESKDERIRKEIINHLILFNNGCYKIPSKDIIDNWIAWLEKQGEQKPTDKIEPKFKVGDKVIPKNHQEESLIITKVTDTEYYSGDLLICKIDEQDKWELAEQDPCKDCTSPNCYFCEHNEHEEIKRMEEVMQNSEWSEEDEKLYQSALWHIKNSCGNQGKTSGEYEVYHFVKSLKDRIQPQPKQEWSEEDEMIYQHCLVILHDYGYDNWLKSFYLQNTWKPSDEQMEALRIAKVYPSSERREILETLYTDLEQLKAL